MPALSKTFCNYISQRWVIVAMCFLANFNTFTSRMCLSIAITEMVLSKNQTFNDTDNTCPQYDPVIEYSNATSIKARTFDWDEKTQGLILSSIEWGFILSSLFGGIIVTKLETKCTIGLSILFMSIFTLLIPITTEWGGPMGLIFLRILIGLGEGTVAPSYMKLMAHWIPEDERSRAAGWIHSGGPIGSVAAMAVSGSIIERSSIGWPAAFYFFGALGIVSVFIHCGFCYNSPSEHPFISDTEKNYLTEKMKHTYKNLPPTPWKHMIRSKAVWALLIGKIGKTWSIMTLSYHMPKFIKSVFKVSVESNGFMTSIPQVCTLIFSLIASWLADLVIAKKVVSIGCVRKISNSIAMIGTWLILIISTYVGCRRNIVVGLQVIAKMMYSSSNFGVSVNPLDLSPNYASTIQGINYGISALTGFLLPYTVGLMTSNQSLNEWRLVFWMLFAICTFTNAVFVIFGSGEVQDWNEPTFLRRQECDKKTDAKDNIELLLKK